MIQVDSIMVTEGEGMIRILIVEDEFLIANLIKETLENQGYFCKCLFDGEHGATEIETEVYDLILLDVMLPKIDGFELLLLLVRNKNIALYRETIYEKIWKDPFCEDTRTVDLHIQRLRKKLGMEKQIQTVFKVGYRFMEQTD